MQAGLYTGSEHLLLGAGMEISLQATSIHKPPCVCHSPLSHVLHTSMRAWFGRFAQEENQHRNMGLFFFNQADAQSLIDKVNRGLPGDHILTDVLPQSCARCLTLGWPWTGAASCLALLGQQSGSLCNSEVAA